jgi:hypothetical protein
VILGFAGLDLMGDTLGINPRLPPQWRGLLFKVCWRGRSVGIRIAQQACPRDYVRFPSPIRPRRGYERLLKSAMRDIRLSFDHLVGASEHARRHREAERLGSCWPAGFSAPQR